MNKKHLTFKKFKYKKYISTCNHDSIVEPLCLDLTDQGHEPTCSLVPLSLKNPISVNLVNLSTSVLLKQLEQNLE